MDEEIWGDAQVTYPDWKGTAQLDSSCSNLLTDAVGLDPTKWLVIGFSIEGGEGAHYLRVIATPLDVWEKVKDDALAGGKVEVTEFLVHGKDPFDVLREIVHNFEFKFTLRFIDSSMVCVKAHSDLPTELFVTETLGSLDNGGD